MMGLIDCAELKKIILEARAKGNTIEVDIDENGDIVFYENERTLLMELPNEKNDTKT